MTEFKINDQVRVTTKNDYQDDVTEMMVTDITDGLVTGLVKGQDVEHMYTIEWPGRTIEVIEDHRDAGAAALLGRKEVTATPRWDALADARGIPWEPAESWDTTVENLFGEAAALLLRKHQDYGPKNISQAPGGAMNGLRVRMHDKIARLNHLIDSGDEPNHESIEDTLLDLANYSLIGVLVLRGLWPDV